MRLPHTTTSLQVHASMAIDLGIHQQRHDHPNSEVRRPLKTGELAPNHTFGKHILDVLGHMLDDPKHEIEGLHLPKGGCI
jgi:hypothetical protein